MNLSGQTAIVVGASSGMGLATAALIHASGGEVVMVGRDEERLFRKAQEIDAGLNRVRCIAADMTTGEGRKRILDGGGRADHLIVTAADLAYMPVEAFTEAAALQVVQSKILAPFFLAQGAAARLRAGGSITLVSGIAAERPIPGGCLTGAVNGAINAMVRGLALELAPIRVNAVSPGWTDTPIWKHVMSEERKAEAFAGMRERIPARRIGQPEDVAMAIIASAANPFVSGTVSYVDGGQRLV
ncbi:MULTISPECIES: SDR family oxidoreductase [unclassified Microbulbifer]|uniref:SDR family oxidoreductase n=1 Tax=unclassified Microbulbifer TaxID=2619833 RepID=UPI0027E41AD4|nr:MULTISPECIES: SDR family oxidoreductase [unclassified Microbulbifer]